MKIVDKSIYVWYLSYKLPKEAYVYKVLIVVVLWLVETMACTPTQPPQPCPPPTLEKGPEPVVSAHFRLEFKTVAGVEGVRFYDLQMATVCPGGRTYVAELDTLYESTQFTWAEYRRWMEKVVAQACRLPSGAPIPPLDSGTDRLH